MTNTAGNIIFQFYLYLFGIIKFDIFVFLQIYCNLHLITGLFQRKDKN
uniref:Uncharacterized protein n=1 Tax=Siphoviridae sp. ctxMM9 TaxID=2827973 RepID=A0A8S5T7T8_9CAUD|nr:MAG TPA: hypothetical protein [Siphoviridae sp. ctxMM9]